MTKNFDEVVKQVATLARLKFPEEELKRYGKKFEAILGYIEKLDELQTEGIKPTSHAISDEEDVTRTLRSDKLSPSTSAEAILQIAPERDSSFIQVPKVIDS